MIGVRKAASEYETARKFIIRQLKQSNSFHARLENRRCLLYTDVNKSDDFPPIFGVGFTGNIVSGICGRIFKNAFATSGSLSRSSDGRLVLCFVRMQAYDA